jgi:hypothetical protein
MFLKSLCGRVNIAAETSEEAVGESGDLDQGGSSGVREVEGSGQVLEVVGGEDGGAGYMTLGQRKAALRQGC